MHFCLSYWTFCLARVCIHLEAGVQISFRFLILFLFRYCPSLHCLFDAVHNLEILEACAQEDADLIVEIACYIHSLGDLPTFRDDEAHDYRASLDLFFHDHESFSLFP
mmetsp:Transcript_15603/g.38491  ORF Transcript_15603/g.38491 Transcript_15603/m.38491 type:complete len:108 (-) Transcript_15603:1032-1355(-)